MELEHLCSCFIHIVISMNIKVLNFTTKGNETPLGQICFSLDPVKMSLPTTLKKIF